MNKLFTFEFEMKIDGMANTHKHGNHLTNTSYYSMFSYKKNYVKYKF